MNPKYKQWLVASAPLVFVLLWSTGYLSGRILRPYVDPLSFSVLRFTAASCILLVIVFYRSAPWPNRTQDWFHLGVCGILIQGFFVTGTMVAVNIGLEMGLAALIGGMQPILTALFAVLWLRESVTNIQKAGFIFGFLGLSLVLYQGIDVGEVPLDALIISVFGMLGITLGTLYQKKYAVDVNIFTGTTIQYLAVLIPICLLAVLFEDGDIEWNTPVIFTALWLIIVQSIGAVLLLYAMISAGAVSRVSSLFYLVPPICVLEGYFLFAETMTVTQLVGILIVTVSVVVVMRKS